MRLISAIKIEGFRSIRDAALNDLGNLTAIAGPNNAGKSNVLRALNAFFAGETDPNAKLDVDTDYFRPELRVKRKKKAIRVEVTFDLPPEFKFRKGKGLEATQKLVGTGSFKIAKQWQREQALATVFLNDKRLNLEEAQYIDQFLRLIKFRYIPNRVLPIDVIRAQHSQLRDLLIRRLGRGPKEEEESFQAIKRVSQQLTQGLAKRLQDTCGGLGEIQLATPSSWRDVALSFAYQIANKGFEIEDKYQGSGIQSLLMLETLYLIDSDVSRTFGWQQGAIWALEEPESSLHTSLEATVAAYLADISSAPGSRLQVICTTHSDLVIQYSGTTVIATAKDNQTILRQPKSVEEALRASATAGISRFVHPILYYPTQPLLLVEGRHDLEFVQEAIRMIRPRRKPRIATLELLEGGKKTGGDELINYVKNNAKLIKSRSTSSPVILLLDWDKGSRVSGFAAVFDSADPFKVFAWPEDKANPKLGVSFKGVERFYSDRLIQEGVNRGARIGKAQDGTWILELPNQDKSKKLLSEIVVAGLTQDDLTYSRNFIEEVLRSAGLL